MKRLLFFLLLSFIGFKSSLAQQSGAQALRLAQSVYEQGRLHEIPKLIKDNIGKFSNEELITAYRLLSLSYIYLEEPEKADSAMLKLLQAGHFYEPNSNVEPAEFMGLYRTFRTKPVFAIGLKAGGSFTFPLLSNVYYVGGNSNGIDHYVGTGKYATKFGFQFGLVFEKEIFEHSKSKFLKRVVFTPEVLYSTRTFTYTDSKVFTTITGTPEATLTATAKQNWIDINPVFQLKMKRKSLLNPYVGFGPGASYLLSAPYTLVLKRTGAVNGSESGPAVNLAPEFRKIVPSAIASAGIKYRFGSIYLVAELRVQYTFLNPINPDKRSSVAAATYNYGYIPSNYKPLNLTANVAFVFPYFNPIKMKNK